MFFWLVWFLTNANQIFHYTRCNTPKRVTSLWGPSPRHCARATQLLSKKCRSGGEPLATLCPIWPARDLNLGPPAPETNALPLDQLEKRTSRKMFFWQMIFWEVFFWCKKTDLECSQSEACFEDCKARRFFLSNKICEIQQFTFLGGIISRFLKITQKNVKINCNLF